MRVPASVFSSSQADAPAYRSYGLELPNASRAGGIDLAMLTATTSESSIMGKCVRKLNWLRGESVAGTGSATGGKRGTHAKVAKINAKGGKYSTKRRAWKSISPNNNETRRAKAVRTSILRPERPRASAPLATAARAGRELSRSCFVSYGNHSLPTRTEVASASLGSM